MPPSKRSEIRKLLRVFTFSSSEIRDAPQKFVGYDIKPKKRIVRKTRLHNNYKYGCPQGILCSIHREKMNQLLELLAMVEHEREFIW